MSTTRSSGLGTRADLILLAGRAPTWKVVAAARRIRGGAGLPARVPTVFTPAARMRSCPKGRDRRRRQPVCDATRRQRTNLQVPAEAGGMTRARRLRDSYQTASRLEPRLRLRTHGPPKRPGRPGRRANRRAPSRCTSRFVMLPIEPQEIAIGTSSCDVTRDLSLSQLIIVLEAPASSHHCLYHDQDGAGCGPYFKNYIASLFSRSLTSSFAIVKSGVPKRSWGPSPLRRKPKRS